MGIVGTVGSGKSALLNAILGEISKHRRSATVEAALATSFLRKFELTHDAAYLQKAREHCSAAESFDRIRPYGFLIIYGLMLTGVLWSVLGPIQETLISVLL